MLNITDSEASVDICNRNGVVDQWTQMEIHAMYVYYALQYLRGQHAEHLLLYFQLRPFIAFFVHIHVLVRRLCIWLKLTLQGVHTIPANYITVNKILEILHTR